MNIAVSAVLHIAPHSQHVGIIPAFFNMEPGEGQIAVIAFSPNALPAIAGVSPANRFAENSADADGDDVATRSMIIQRTKGMHRALISCSECCGYVFEIQSADLCSCFLPSMLLRFTVLVWRASAIPKMFHVS